MTDYPNPTAELAEITAQLDALTSELKAALEQKDTPPGGVTGIERIPGLLARAAQLTPQKAPLDERAQAMERYIAVVAQRRQANAALPPYTQLTDRIKALLGEAEAADAAARDRIRVMTQSEAGGRTAALALGVDRLWIEDVHAGNIT